MRFYLECYDFIGIFHKNINFDRTLLILSRMLSVAQDFLCLTCLLLRLKGGNPLSCKSRLILSKYDTFGHVLGANILFQPSLVSIEIFTSFTNSDVFNNISSPIQT
jgi:hypothetical protein